MRRPASIRRALPRLVSRAALSLLLAGFLAGGPLHAEGGLKLAGAGGGSLDTSELEAGDAVVFVWASWSPRCRDIEQQVNAAQNRWSGRLRVVSVSFQEDGDTVSSFLAGKRLAVPTYLDTSGAFAKKHAVTTLPSLLIFRRGEVVFHGRIPADVDRVIASAFDHP